MSDGDGYNAGFDDGYQEGFDAGIEQADEKLTDEITRLRSANAEPVEALEPFKERADKWSLNEDTAWVNVRLRDLRKAAAVLAKHKPT